MGSRDEILCFLVHKNHFITSYHDQKFLMMNFGSIQKGGLFTVPDSCFKFPYFSRAIIDAEDPNMDGLLQAIEGMAQIKAQAKIRINQDMKNCLVVSTMFQMG